MRSPAFARGSAIRWIATLAIGGAVACSLVVRSDRDQCATDDECIGHNLGTTAVCVSNVCVQPEALPLSEAGTDANDSGPEDPIWGCLGRVPPLPAIEKASAVHFFAQFRNLNREPLVGLPVKACVQLDVACNGPYEGSNTQTDSDGRVDVVLHSGFRGFLDISTSTAYANLMPSLAYVQPIPDKARPPDGGVRVPWTLLTKDEVGFYAQVAGKTLDPKHGHLLFSVLDCQGNLAADTVLRAETVTADTFTYYLDTDGQPNLTQAKTGPAGNGGYMNLPTGSVTVTLSRASGQRIASQNVIMRAGTITYTLFEPTP